MADAEYMVMVSHIKLGTEVEEMPQECELSKLPSSYKELSTLTLKGGKTLILKDNSEIMVPKSERENILQIAHQTHLGQEMMVHQLRGKVFWAGMNSDIKEMVAKCDLCQRYHRSHAKEKVEVSHAAMFNPICHGGRWFPPPPKEKFNYSIIVYDKVTNVFDFS